MSNDSNRAVTRRPKPTKSEARLYSETMRALMITHPEGAATIQRYVMALAAEAAANRVKVRQLEHVIMSGGGGDNDQGH